MTRPSPHAAPPTTSRRTALRTPARRIAAAFAGTALVAVVLGGPGAAVAAAQDASASAASPAQSQQGMTMQARPLLGGHGRVGSWMAIAVDVANSGPPIVGELQIAGGVTGRTRFSTAVDLPTGSSKRYFLYGQPPSFGNVEVGLVQDGRTIRTAKFALTLHEQTQLLVGVVAEQAPRLVGSIDLQAATGSLVPAVVPLSVADLPERVEAWEPIDRVVWQDVEMSQLSPAQLAALRGWLAGGGQLVVVGGTAGPGTLAALPDDLVPYRPTSTLDVDAAAVRGLLGQLPDNAATLPALAGDPGSGRPLATSGDRVIAAERVFGSGLVTLVGFDPTTPWIADSKKTSTPLWQHLIPARQTSTQGIADDSQLISAVSNLPSLALPPVGGLIALLFGYIVLVGPVNYLVLRRIDRREWAWLTIPVLIVVFTVGAFGFGASLRGSDVIVHEVAIVRGAPGTTVGTVQSYLGVFSPSRATYHLRVPGGALLSSPTNGDVFGADGSGPMDVVQGDPSEVRGLTVGFGSLRAVRAEASTDVPLVEGDLRLENGTVTGVVRNKSTRTLLRPAVVFGASSVVLSDIAPGSEVKVNLTLTQNPQFQGGLSDRVLGTSIGGNNPGGFDAEAQRMLVRRAVVDQLAFDPSLGGGQGQLQTDRPLLLAWGNDPVLSVDIDGQRTQRVANILYEVPLPLAVHGATTFRSDLMRSTVVASDAQFFSKDPFTISVTQGTLEMAFRPIPFTGSLDPDRLFVGMQLGGDPTTGGVRPAVLEPVACPPAKTKTQQPDDALRCVDQPDVVDGLPDVQIRDRGTGGWIPFPHFDPGRSYELKDATRWIDPSTGELRVKFVANGQGGTPFSFSVQLQGNVS
ncbi:MAG: hypothetical protein ACJ77N_11690 [Chloroflexota bacterium]